MTDTMPIVELIGKESFEWLANKFSKESTLRDIPDEILSRIASLDITTRDYGGSRDAITSIALITFAYKLANMAQKAQDGANDILLLKALAKKEKSRREGRNHLEHSMWDAPLFELITGEVGERIRSMRTMNNPA